jgi:hypothetical protein
MASYNQSAILAFNNYNAQVECIQEAFEEFYDEMDYYENQELYGDEESEESGFSPVELTEAQEAEQQETEAQEAEQQEAEAQEAEWAQEQAREEWHEACDQAWQEADQHVPLVNQPELETAW